MSGVINAGVCCN